MSVWTGITCLPCPDGWYSNSLDSGVYKQNTTQASQDTNKVFKASLINTTLTDVAGPLCAPCVDVRRMRMFPLGFQERGVVITPPSPPSLVTRIPSCPPVAPV